MKHDALAFLTVEATSISVGDLFGSLCHEPKAGLALEGLPSG